jgi:type II secretory pathway pseudopilin PulG
MNNERGITIIETTVVLSVLFILAGVMSPIVSEMTTTARAVKAKNDASMIATGLINLQKDLGGDALGYGGAAVASAMSALSARSAAPSTPAMADVLATGGDEPGTDDPPEVVAASAPPLFNFLRGATVSAAGPERGVERPGRRRWFERVDSLDAHLRSNERGYRYRRPGEYGGWNGPYVSAEVKGDPWGNQYVINTRWLDGGSTAADSQGRPRRAVFVVSAGNNGIIETPFEQSIVDAKAYGDDIVIRIQ